MGRLVYRNRRTCILDKRRFGAYDSPIERRTTMTQALFSEPRFTDDDAARAHLEALRWPSGPVCPHCGATERNSRLNGPAHRPGVIFCGDCPPQFPVAVG